MPEVRECFIHYTHAHYVLVEELGLSRNHATDWTLLGLFADAAQKEIGQLSCLTDRHAKGYLDKLNSTCTIRRGQTAHQTRIWPGTDDAPEPLDGLVLSGLSWTPRSLILKFGRLDLQVCLILFDNRYDDSD